MSLAGLSLQGTIRASEFLKPSPVETNYLYPRLRLRNSGGLKIRLPLLMKHYPNSYPIYFTIYLVNNNYPSI